MEIEVAVIWKLFRRRWGLILAIILLMVSVTGFLSFYWLKPEYQATVTMIVKNQTTDRQIFYDDLIASEKLHKTYDEIAKSRRVVQEVKDKLQLPETSEDLLKRLRVESDNDSLITLISVTDNSQERAAQIANEFAAFSSEVMNQIMGVESVYLLDEAKKEDQPIPVSPRPYVNMTISFVLALLIGMGIAYFLESIDKTIKSEEQLLDLLDLPVLGVVPVVKKRARKKKAEETAALGGAVT